MNIAIIGAGIAGLTSAYELTKSGHQVVVYEAADKTGGLASSRGWPGSLIMSCLNKNFGGCGGKWNAPGQQPRILMDGLNNMVSEPEFVNAASDNYQLLGTSIAISAGDDGNVLGAYGGEYPINDAEIPSP